MRKRAAEGLLTDEERADFPALAKIEKALQEVSTKQATSGPAPQPAKEEHLRQQQEDPTEDVVQDAIDSVPVLAGWQASDPEKWKRAVAHDEVLRESPKWKDKPLTERFAHVAKVVADEYDEQIVEQPRAAVSSPAPKQPAQAARQDPREAAQQAARKAPSTLSDFKGGTPEASRDPMDRLPAFKQVAKFSDMTDAEIDAHLARLG